MKGHFQAMAAEPEQPLGDSHVARQSVESPYLTIEGCAAFLHLSVKAFRRLLERHPSFPKANLGPRTVRFDRDEVRAYVRYINSPEYRTRRAKQAIAVLRHDRISLGSSGRPR